MKKTIFLVRHGEGENNVGTHYTDDTVPLTEKGREQAQFIARRVSKLPVDVLISSTMERARETAAYIAQVIQKPIEFSDLFVERRYPTALVGLSRKSEEGRKMWLDWTSACVGVGPKVGDGDDFEGLKIRAWDAIRFLEQREEQNIVVATHGSFMKFVCMTAIYGDALSPLHMKDLVYGLRINNTGLTIMHYDPKDGYKPWWLSVWNDHAHLG